MSYSKHKDDLPENTVKRIENILLSLGVELDYQYEERVDGIFSSTLSDKKHHWNTSGKGTTESYCAASAFGEAIEHICNYHAYDTSYITEDSDAYLGFSRYCDETVHSIFDLPNISPHVYTDMAHSYELGSNKKATKQQLCKLWCEWYGKETTSFVPYYSVKEKTIKILPDRIIANLCGSNGCGAGNTPEEAISHALDEIAERYVKYKIYMNRLTPPEVPTSYIYQRCPELAEIMKKIVQQGNYRIIVKDASLGQGFCVICVLLIDIKKQRYLANFGAHPCFEIALERCLTELFQAFKPNSASQSRKNMVKWQAFSNQRFSNIKNWVSILRDDDGEIPDSFFAGEPSWAFHPWDLMDDYDNKKGLKMQLAHFLKIAPDIYIRDNSYLGFPVYRVYIPEFSTSHLPFDEYQLHCFQLWRKLPDIIANCHLASKEELRELADTVFSHKTYTGSLVFKNLGEAKTNALYAALLYDIGEKEKSKQVLEVQDDIMCKCILRGLELSSDKEVSSSQRNELLRLFFGDTLAEFAACWSGENVFANMVRVYIKTGLINMKKTSLPKTDIEAINAFHKILKERIREGIRDQNAINNIVC